MKETRHNHTVEETVWPWRRAGGESPGPDAASGRGRRALIEAAAAAAVGTLFLLLFGNRVVAAVAYSVAAIVALGGLFVPALYDAFRKAGLLLARGVGIALSWVLLAPFFYVCFTFGRLVLLLLRKDPLARKCPSDEETYWQAREPVPGPEHYTRQF